MDSNTTATSHKGVGPEYPGFLRGPLSTTFASIIAAYIIWYSALNKSGNNKFKAPIVGPWDTIRARWQFFRNASTLLNEGYEKASSRLRKWNIH